MDLVRLGLERARSAGEALDVMCELLTTCGQGGVADAAHGEAYDSSFLIADTAGAFILDTSGRDYAAAPVALGGSGGAAISNRLSLTTEWTRGSDSLEDGDDFDRFRSPLAPTAFADVRLATSRRFLETQGQGGLTPAATAAHLRDHGHGPWGEPGGRGRGDRGSGDISGISGISDISICMHARGLVVTAASLIAVLPAEREGGAPLRTFVALGSPCASIYVPAFPATAGGPPPFVPLELSRPDLWHAADQLRRRIEADPAVLAGIRHTLDPVEDELWAEADDVVDRPGRWSEVGRDWGRRALDALSSCIT
jgi:secernin